MTERKTVRPSVAHRLSRSCRHSHWGRFVKYVTTCTAAGIVAGLAAGYTPRPILTVIAVTAAVIAASNWRLDRDSRLVADGLSGASWSAPPGSGKHLAVLSEMQDRVARGGRVVGVLIETEHDDEQ